MLDSYVKQFTKIFELYGDPSDNNEYYESNYSKKALENLAFFYRTYSIGLLKEALAGSGIIPRVKVWYQGDIDKLISDIKNDSNYSNAEVIFIASEIKDIAQVEKIKETFKDKKILLTWNEEITFVDDVLDAMYMIDYYKSVVDDSLSPLEKVALVYDIIKSHIFTRDDTPNNSSSSRRITKIVNNDKIVCVGYVRLFNRVLEELGFRTYTIHLNMEKDVDDSGHVRSIVEINDPKYEVDGPFVFDPTWDSPDDLYFCMTGKNGNITSFPKEGYRKVDSLSSYKHFLIPLSLYEKKYPNSYNERIERGTKSLTDAETRSLLHEEQIDSEFNYLTPIALARLLSVIKEKEGYPREMIPDIVQESLFLSRYGLYSKDDIAKHIEENKQETR